MKKTTRAILISIIAVSAMCAACLKAFSSFEGSYAYGIGPISISLGGSASGSNLDTLGYLTNPAEISLVISPRYSFALVNFNKTISGDDGFKYYVASYARNKKAFNFISGTDTGMKRNLVSYVMSLPFKEYHAGAEIAAFNYTTPSFVTVSGLSNPADKGSGLSVSFGASKRFASGLVAGISLQNAINNISSSSETQVSGLTTTLPSVYNFGLSYPLRDWLVVSAGFKLINYQNSDSPDSSRDTLFYIGAQYHMNRSPLAAIAGTITDNIFLKDQKDRSAAFGVNYRTANYDVSVGGLNYNDSFSSPVAASVSYKTNPGEWVETPKPAEKKTPETEKQTPAQPEPKKPVYEQPLPSSNETEQTTGEDTLLAAAPFEEDEEDFYDGQPAKPSRNLSV
ncbi:MAG TPA: hypothetical protein PLQ76_09200, partial [bacterium]|nr:hypothetical protein [bacterium]